MTTRLYLEDPYRMSFEADIVEQRETAEGPVVVFEATYFYPESGGQPHDLGTIDGIPVTRVAEHDGDTILHFVEHLPERKRVSCEIDEVRRRDHMQQHSGQHILSAAFVREVDARTTSFHLGAETSTIDLDQWPLTDDGIARAEKTANDIVRRALPIRGSFVDAETARQLELRKPPPGDKRLRIVDVEGFDKQACCGTHPRSSAEVGPIVIRSTEKLKDGTRVEFLCGDRALRDYKTTVTRIRSLARILSAAESDLVATAKKLQEERKSQAKELKKLRGAALVSEAETWMDESDTLGELSVLTKRVPGLEPAAIRTVASHLVDRPGRVVLLGGEADGRAHLVFACSKDVAFDMGQLLSLAVVAVEGRGGGSARIAQGGGPLTAGLPLALDVARNALVPS